jgi:hypothetical protein
MHPEQIAYLASILIAWCWALSQIKLAIRELHDEDISWWRINAAQWITVKAVFITYVGIYAWDDIPANDGMVYVFVASHLCVFIHWLRLPSPSKTDPLYAKDPV